MAEKRSFNIRDKETGLIYVINLTVIHYMYSHVQKADRFILEKKSGKKSKHIPLFSDIIPISNRRFYYMRNGYNFAMTTSDINAIIELFGIDIRYFHKNSPVFFELDDFLTSKDWRQFFKENMEKKDGDHSSPEEKKDGEEKKNKVQKALEHLVKKKWNEARDKNNPLFAIYYYFHTGVKYEQTHKTVRCIELLEETSYNDWIQEDYATLEKSASILKNHYDYVQAILTLNKLNRLK